MKPTGKAFRIVILTAVVWGIASTLTRTMGPINTYLEAIRLAWAGEISEALRTFWTAADMFSCLNDFMTVVGFLSVVAHYASVLAFVCEVFLYTPRQIDKQQ